VSEPKPTATELWERAGYAYAAADVIIAERTRADELTKGLPYNREARDAFVRGRLKFKAEHPEESKP
jgi:hypothetical protein